MHPRKVSLLAASVALLLICAQPVGAKTDEGYLIIKADPPETYIYADGIPYVEANGHFIKLTPGVHKIDLYNYGYKPECCGTAILAGPVHGREKL
ncbi:MAG: hypothetical protein ABSG32_20420 [Terriglobia bacterium]|jgi:hypothetical protein